jgi:hypothetical protein
VRDTETEMAILSYTGRALDPLQSTPFKHFYRLVLNSPLSETKRAVCRFILPVYIEQIAKLSERFYERTQKVQECPFKVLKRSVVTTQDLILFILCATMGAELDRSRLYWKLQKVLRQSKKLICSFDGPLCKSSAYARTSTNFTVTLTSYGNAGFVSVIMLKRVIVGRRLRIWTKWNF